MTSHPELLYPHQVPATDLTTENTTAAKLAADAVTPKSLPAKATTTRNQSADNTKLGLPTLDISAATNASSGVTSLESKAKSDWQGTKNVTKDLAEGAENEIDNHPGKLVLDAGIGLATGVGVTLATASAPIWVPLGLAGLGVAGLAYEAHKHLPGILDEMKVAADPQNYNQVQVTDATSGLQNLGGELTDTAASSLGAMDGTTFALGIVKGWVGAAAGGAASADATAAEDTGEDLDRDLTPEGKKQPPPSQTKGNQPPSKQPENQQGQPAGQDQPPSTNGNSKPGSNNSAEPGDNGSAKPGDKSSAKPASDDSANPGEKESATRPGDKASASAETKEPSQPENQSASKPKAAAPSSAKILNQLANGKLTNVRHETDGGLVKDVIRGTATDGESSTDAFIKKIDPNSQADLERVRKAQIETNVDKATGVDTRAPLTALRNDVEVDGQKQLIAVQEDGGKSLGANLKDWATQEFGSADPDNIQKLIEAHPSLKESIGKALFQMLYKGNSDFMELSNLAVRGTQNGAEVSLDKPLDMPIIDAKYNWTISPEAAAGAPQQPTWGIAMSMEDSLPGKVADLFAGKRLSDISPELQTQAETLEQFYESAQGQAQLQKAGLSPTEISAAASRLQSMVTQGYPPMPTPGSQAFDNMLNELGAQGDYYNQRSQSANLQQMLAEQQSQSS